MPIGRGHHSSARLGAEPVYDGNTVHLIYRSCECQRMAIVVYPHNSVTGGDFNMINRVARVDLGSPNNSVERYRDDLELHRHTKALVKDIRFSLRMRFPTMK